METTERLAEFVFETMFDDMPQVGIENAKRSIFDCIGVTLAGAYSLPSKIIAELVNELGGLPKAAVFGRGFRTSSCQAALVNGTSAHALDYDDNISTLSGHPSAVLVPTILALGEELGTTGKRVLEAYVIGLEVAAKIGRGINKGHYEKGWHATGTLGTLGAAAAAAKLLDLGRTQIRIALGIAASGAAGLRENFGTMTKPLHAGNAARNGIFAALLAQRGFTATNRILESQFGFCEVLSKNNQYDLGVITSNLGDPLDIVVPGVNLKPYPTCLCTHTALDAMLELMSRYNVLHEEVEDIEVKTHPYNVRVLTYSNPRTGFEGKFSMQFCLAVSLISGQVGIRDFNDEKVLDPRIRELMKKIRVIPDSELEEEGRSKDSEYLPSIVKIRLRRGDEYTQRIDYPKGHPLKPLSREELVCKYRDCAGTALSDEAVEQSIEIIDHFENIQDIKTLADLLIGEEACPSSNFRFS